MSYQRKFLPDGTPNPRWKPDTRKRSEDRHKSAHKRGTSRPSRYVRKHGFIAIDGEGITDETGKHRYVLLCASSGEHIINEQGLSTRDCFDFLLSIATNYPKSILVGYGLSYDINMWLGDLDKATLRNVVHPGEHAPRWHGYSIAYRPRKSFTLRKWGNPLYQEKVTQHKDGTTSITYLPNYRAIAQLYDVFGFFQCSFVEALTRWDIPVDREHIHAMKTRRNRFTLAELAQDILPYCQQEVQALAQLMDRFHDALVEAGIDIKRYDGSGAIASALLSQAGIKEHLREALPPDCYQAQLHAYAGGRAELGQFGAYFGPVWNYDIHSAYPSVMPELPSLTGGRWQHRDGHGDAPYALMHVRWNFDESLPYYPFFFRDSDECIYFPARGEGWYWQPEVQAALRAYEAGKLSTKKKRGKIHIIESWEFHPASSVKPFAFIPALYDRRAEWKAQGNPAEKIIKLGINSMYGKLAQSIGGSHTQKPPFHNIGYAGYITSMTRARIFETLMHAPEHIVQITIDGIYSTCPLPLDIGPGLGQFGCTEIAGIIAVQSGVYFGLHVIAEPTREEQEKHPARYFQHDGSWYLANAHYQGYDPGSLTPAMVLNAWTRANLSLPLRVPSTRFVTLSSALCSDQQWQQWQQWRTIDRELDLLPQNKRNWPEQVHAIRPHQELIKTTASVPRCMYTTKTAISYPYTLKWERNKPAGIVDGIDSTVYESEALDSFL